MIDVRQLHGLSTVTDRPPLPWITALLPHNLSPMWDRILSAILVAQAVAVVVVLEEE